MTRDPSGNITIRPAMVALGAILLGAIGAGSSALVTYGARGSEIAVHHGELVRLERRIDRHDDRLDELTKSVARIDANTAWIRTTLSQRGEPQ